MKHLITACLAICALTFVGSVAHADSSNCPLTSIGPLYVKVFIEEDSTKAGIDQKAIQTKVELRLREAGIPVTTDSSGPWLSVHVNTLESSDEQKAAVRVTLYVIEDSTLSRMPAKPVVVTTWKNAYYAMVTPAKAYDEAVACLNDNMDVFANDYLKDNPKPSASSALPARKQVASTRVHAPVLQRKAPVNRRA